MFGRIRIQFFVSIGSVRTKSGFFWVPDPFFCRDQNQFFVGTGSVFFVGTKSGFLWAPDPFFFVRNKSGFLRAPGRVFLEQNPGFCGTGSGFSCPNSNTLAGRLFYFQIDMFNNGFLCRKKKV